MCRETPSDSYRGLGKRAFSKETPRARCRLGCECESVESRVPQSEHCEASLKGIMRPIRPAFARRNSRSKMACA